MSILLCGYLTKEGGKSHKHQNSKKRWFVLQEGFLSYYEANPVTFKGKDVNNLKGRIFLCGCTTEDGKKPLSFQLVSVKEYIIKGQTEDEIVCWRNAIDYAIENANVEFEDSRPFTGWLQKKGGRGHKYSNWQRRWFKLQGNLWSYYSDEVKKKNNVQNLKGTVDISLLSELVTEANGGSKNHCFSIVVNNEKEFLIAASSAEEKAAWCDALIERKEHASKAYGTTGLDMVEIVEYISLPSVKMGRSFKKSCICITNINIRIYKSERILDDEESWDFFDGLIYTIPLIGTTVQISRIGTEDILVIMDSKGNKFLLKNQDIVETIYSTIRKGANELVSKVVNAGSNIYYNCYAETSGNDSHSGYTLVRLNREIASFRFLQNNEHLEIPLDSIKSSEIDNSQLKLIYIESSGEQRELHFASESSISLSDSLNQIRGVEIKDTMRVRGESFAVYSTNNDFEDEEIKTTNTKGKKKDVSLEDFELLKVIGRGAFGKVLLVKHNQTGRIYAMKSILKKSLVNHAKEIEHTLAERAVMMKLDHPFLMKLHYTFQTKDKLLYVMDYINGGELYFHLENEGVFSIERARFYIAELASAMAYLHENGIVYRDIKTENILLNADGHIVLTDFGLSKELTTDDRTGTLCGTPVYLPPEMLLKQEYNQSVDFWSMGILLFEMITGDVPFYHDNIQKMFRMIVKDPVPFPSEMEAFPDLIDIINRLLEKKPELRMQDFNEFKAHPFFDGLNWESLLKKEISAPFVPDTGSAGEVKNVADEILDEEVGFDVEEALTREEEKMFNDIEFDFVT